MVVRGTLEEGDRASWDIRDGSGEAVFDATFQPARVERVEIGVERCVALSSWPISNVCLSDTRYLLLGC